MKNLLILLLVLSLPASYCAASDASMFFNGGIISIDQPVVQISKVFGIKITPRNITLKNNNKVNYFAHKLENLSKEPSSIVVTLKYVSVAKGWTAELLVDDNGDGVWQEGETTPLSEQSSLNKGSGLFFFIKLTRPDNLTAKAMGSAIVAISCPIADGQSYRGDNGIQYGGEDSVDSTDTVIYHEI